MTDAGRNPGRIIPGVLRAFADRHTHRRVRIVGEPMWPQRSSTEYPACAQHEALLNTAFRVVEATILCPYDAEGLSPVVLADAAATHPVLVDRDQWWTSPGYAPDRIVDGYNQPLDAPGDADEIPVAPAGLRRIRDWATRLATAAGLVGERLDDVAYTVNELATNSTEHGSGRARVRAWRTDTAFAVQADNAGRLPDPLVGRRPARPGQPRGRGLLLVNMLADLVRVHTAPNHVTVRAYFDRP
jgi:anti-sigma regulatory factor (Ser/Thr protein kinase)